MADDASSFYEKFILWKKPFRITTAYSATECIDLLNSTKQKQLSYNSQNFRLLETTPTENGISFRGKTFGYGEKTSTHLVGEIAELDDHTVVSGYAHLEKWGILIFLIFVPLLALILMGRDVGGCVGSVLLLLIIMVFTTAYGIYSRNRLIKMVTELLTD